MSGFIISCSEKRQEPLKLGTTVWVGYEPLYLGREHGFIDKQQFNLVEYLSASQVIQSFRNETIDIAALTMDEVLILADKGIEVIVILVMDTSNGGDVIMAQNKYTSFSELKGKRVGYENTALGAYVLSRALKKNNLNSSDIFLVPMNVNETERALKNSEVEAVVTFEPARTRLIENNYKEVFSSREIPNEIFDVLVVRKELLDENYGRLKDLVSGWFKSLEYFNEHEVESLNFMNQRLKLPDAGLKTAFNGIVFPSKSDNLIFLGDKNKSGTLSENTRRLLSNMMQNKLIKNSIDTEHLFDSNYLND